MSIRVQFDVVRYRNDLNGFVYKLGADSTQLLKEEMRLLLRDIERLTPPKTLAQGRKAIAGDLSRVAAPLDSSKIRFGPLSRAVAKKDQEAIKSITENMKRGFFKGRRFLATVGELKDAHLAARNSRGRVRNDQRNMALVGVWKKYTKEVQDRVAYTRAGWLAAAYGVGLQMSSWVTRHAGYAKGSYKQPTPQTLSISGTNRSSKIPDYQRVVEMAMRNRQYSLGKELKRLMDGGKTRRASLAHTEYGKADA